MNSTRVGGTSEGGTYDAAPARRLLLTRGVVLYIVARLVAGAFIGLQNDWLASLQLRAGRADSSHMAFGMATSAAFVLLVGILMLLDIRRRHEASLFANLGFSSIDIAACGILPAIAGEFALALFGLIGR